ncbi:MAG: hypothetical protein AAFY91_10575 [Bacteroidota bacterium]
MANSTPNQAFNWDQMVEIEAEDAQVIDDRVELNPADVDHPVSWRPNLPADQMRRLRDASFSGGMAGGKAAAVFGFVLMKVTISAVVFVLAFVWALWSGMAEMLRNWVESSDNEDDNDDNNKPGGYRFGDNNYQSGRARRETIFHQETTIIDRHYYGRPDNTKGSVLPLPGSVSLPGRRVRLLAAAGS